MHGNFELPGIPEGPGASYPDWRLNATKRARRAGLGDVGRAMEWAMFGSEEGTTDRKREPRGRSLVRHGIGSPPEEGLLDDLDSE